jgi:hypothetical protein
MYPNGLHAYVYVYSGRLERAGLQSPRTANKHSLMVYNRWK